MAMSAESLFKCPHCASLYKVVRVEADDTHDREVRCPACGSALEARDGNFFLKYFRVYRPRYPVPRPGAYAAW
jgi:predicted Zn finger-like uncharacterized protein